MSYSERGKRNPFDAYMTGVCLWLTPRQILILERMCSFFADTVEKGVEEEAFLDFKSQIDYEAEVKKRKYFGGDDEEAYTLFDPS
jgi:hypothetical protein